MPAAPSRPVRALARARSAREPAVYLFEDLHWFDRASEEFIENLIGISPGNRTLVLLNFRPEYHAGWMQRSYYQQLPLLPLGPEAIRELLADLLGSDPSLGHLTDLIQERAGGNPFFIEEILQSLVDTGVVAGTKGAYCLVTPVKKVGLPVTVQSVLAARIDRLCERDKRLLPWRRKPAVKPQHRSFAQHRALAAAAARKGGQTSQSRRIGSHSDNADPHSDDDHSGGTNGNTNNG